MFVSRIEAESTTLAEALERYALDAAPKKKDAYHVTLRCRRLSKRTLARKALAAIRGKDIAAFIRERQDEGVGTHMIRLGLVSPSHLFNTARTAWGMESPLTNPVYLVKGQRPKLPGARTRRLVSDEPRAFWPPLSAAIETAMRRGEIAAMRREHLDRTPHAGGNEARVLLIPETKTVAPRRVGAALHGGVGGPGRAAPAPRWARVGYKAIQASNMRPDSIPGLREGLQGRQHRGPDLPRSAA